VTGPADSNPRKRLGGDRSKKKMVAHNRDNWGATVSFSTDNGHTRTVHRDGTLIEAVAACAQAIDRYADDGPWYVEAISTPQSIYDDLKGTFHQERHFRERVLLGRIGRKDLLRLPASRPPANSNQKPGHAWRKLYERGPIR
jgi:hypothetical protein